MKRRWMAIPVVVLVVLVGCYWYTTAADIIDAAEPTVVSLIDVVNPALAPTMQEVDASVKLASSILRNWKPDKYNDAINAINAALANLNKIAPQLTDQQKTLATIIAGGLTSVLDILEQHAPANVKKAVRPAVDNLGTVPKYKDAKEYKAAWNGAAPTAGAKPVN